MNVSITKHSIEFSCGFLSGVLFDDGLGAGAASGLCGTLVAELPHVIPWAAISIMVIKEPHKLTIGVRALKVTRRGNVFTNLETKKKMEFVNGQKTTFLLYPTFSKRVFQEHTANYFYSEYLVLC